MTAMTSMQTTLTAQMTLPGTDLDAGPNARPRAALIDAITYEWSAFDIWSDQLVFTDGAHGTMATAIGNARKTLLGRAYYDRVSARVYRVPPWVADCADMHQTLADSVRSQRLARMTGRPVRHGISSPSAAA